VNKDLREAAQRPLSFWQTLRAVAWSFFGVRKGAEHERDMAQLNPVHVILAGLIGAGLFILALLMLVRWVIASGVAA
jgi:Protein of unknown function (DUF2970)